MPPFQLMQGTELREAGDAAKMRRAGADGRLRVAATEARPRRCGRRGSSSHNRSRKLLASRLNHMSIRSIRRAAVTCFQNASQGYRTPRMSRR